MKSKVILLVVMLSVLILPFSRVFGADDKADLDAVKTYLFHVGSNTSRLAASGALLEKE